MVVFIKSWLQLKHNTITTTHIMPQTTVFLHYLTSFIKHSTIYPSLFNPYKKVIWKNKHFILALLFKKFCCITLVYIVILNVPFISTSGPVKKYILHCIFFYYTFCYSCSFPPNYNSLLSILTNREFELINVSTIFI